MTSSRWRNACAVPGQLSTMFPAVKLGNRRRTWCIKLSNCNLTKWHGCSLGTLRLFGRRNVALARVVGIIEFWHVVFGLSLIPATQGEKIEILEAIHTLLILYVYVIGNQRVTIWKILGPENAVQCSDDPSRSCKDSLLFILRARFKLPGSEKWR